MQAFQTTSNNDFSSQEQPLQISNSLSKTSQPSFSPFLSKNTLRVPAPYGFSYGAACYNPRHNMIIACPGNKTTQFYDASTLLPHKERETQKLAGIVMQMSFNPETDTYIMGCTGGEVHTYNASCHELKKLKAHERQLLTATFIDPSSYVFSFPDAKKLILGTLENDNTTSFDSQNSDVFCLQHVPQRKLLLSGVTGGYVIIYRTDKLPCLRVVCSARAHLKRMLVLTVQRIIINRKEYVITAGQECAVKIWHLRKGKMKLLRVIWTEEIPYSVAYLENYRMLVIASECNYVKFVRLPFGRLERTVYLAKDDKHGLFLMKEKNMIGVTSYNDNLIEFIQLEGAKEDQKNI